MNTLKCDWTCEIEEAVENICGMPDFETMITSAISETLVHEIEHEMARENSWRTAIVRRDISAPARWLRDRDRLGLYDRILDFGCGRGTDADLMDLEKYDPHFFPEYPTGKFDTILCTYVLNTLSEIDQEKVLGQIKTLLRCRGQAYVTVRRNIKKEGFTGKGTYQRNVVLSDPYKVIHENADFCTYEYRKP